MTSVVALESWARTYTKAWPILAASVAALLTPSPAGSDAAVPHSSGLADRKAPPLSSSAADDPRPLFATLVQTHTDERVTLDAILPTADRFSALLSDRATGEDHPLDPRLLELLRTLAQRHPAARFELVSGYRSPKLNEMLRKKGHHVASHSQHSLGHAVDFRIVEPGADTSLDPQRIEREVRDLGWQGGVGVYLLPGDRFVHVDVGSLRRWNG
jgi:uncharacterized protein YcbK (DUF882 family)